MKVLLKDLPEYKIQRVVFCSIEQALFQAFVVIDDEEHLVWKTTSEAIRGRNLMEMRELFSGMDVGPSFLRHESPYDEMIGHEKNEYGNRLEVPLGDDLYAPTEWLN